jgi:hypothetical protein
MSSRIGRSQDLHFSQRASSVFALDLIGAAELLAVEDALNTILSVEGGGAVATISTL